MQAAKEPPRRQERQGSPRYFGVRAESAARAPMTSGQPVRCTSVSPRTKKAFAPLGDLGVLAVSEKRIRGMFPSSFSLDLARRQRGQVRREHAFLQGF